LIKTGAVYRHFKGNEYLVLHMAKSAETEEEFVVYQAMYGERGIWIRPLSQFDDTVERDGATMKRFEEIGR
jgi:hypothetical protein